MYKGISYYQTSMEERYFHPDNESLKPSGILGHGYGIIGSSLMIVGMLFYILRKRIKALSRWGKLKDWLEVHIFLCTMGPILILFHTSFKFGGIVAVSFWSMVAVFLSGVIGRFIYIQIPRSIEGRELSLAEVRGMKTDLNEVLKNKHNLPDETVQIILSAISMNTYISYKNPFVQYYKKLISNIKTIGLVKNTLKKHNLPSQDISSVVSLVKSDISLSRKLERLNTMQKLFKYWHVAHLPFAIIMIAIMVVHVAVAITFGYKWIF
jgi:hypothetical protein